MLRQRVSRERLEVPTQGRLDTSGGMALLATRPRDAVRAAEARLALRGDDPAALLMLGAGLRRCGTLDRAEAALTTITQRQPGAWGAWYELGVTRALGGALQAALEALGRAAALNPDALLAASALADHQALTSEDTRQEGAIAPARRLRGRADLQRLSQDLDRDPPSGEELAAAGLDANDPVSASVLAQAALDLGQPAAAERWLATAVTRWPGYAPLQRTLAIAQLAQNRGPAALETVRRLAARHPELPLDGLRADALVQAREDAAARDVLEQMVVGRPDQIRAWIALGHVRKTLGDGAGAAAAYRAAIARAPDCGEAYAGLADLKTHAFSASDVAALQAQLARPDLGAAVSADLRFALAKALEDAGDPGAAFQQYRQANAIRRTHRPHDAAAHTAFVRRSCEVLTREALAARAGHGCPDPAPIFVVGLPRAGSTLVEQILACHPDVEGCDELPILPDIAREAVRRANGLEADYPAALLDLPPEDLRSLGEAYVAAAQPYRKLDRPRFVDKFPGNVLHLGLIAMVLPRARIIDIRRDPEPCCLSLFRQNFAEGQHYSHDLKDLGRYYRDYVRLMDHMAEVLPRPPIEVRYESLVTDPETEIRRLLSALDLSFHQACLSPHASGRPVRTASAEQVRRPISAAGLDGWRVYEPWLAPLREGLDEAP